MGKQTHPIDGNRATHPKVASARVTALATGHCFCAATCMSQAFVKESDEQWLHEIAPTMNALILYLTRENNGIRVYEKSNRIDPKTNKEVYLMSNGLQYTIDSAGHWSIV
ncbi:hypothetical protein [Paraflavitalea speifideaquila]|uniref:hypothetical protein n=1 Tax=Paraflavitalea speifideaquila TaxID=3076558 RepID=UPI0028E63BA2|nr:hypothetical protein [Paraflavitalea speifideiaquila]